MFQHQYNDLLQWYEQNIPLYQDLTAVAEHCLEDLIKRSGIRYLTVTSRTKSAKSLIDKVRSKRYKNPKEENTDFAAVRVVTYIEPDVRKICDLIKSSFNVHPDKSIDKAMTLDIDQVGYRSIHFICDLGEARLQLPENAHFKEMVFEVQVRTLLQHAWAEIHYSRGYKFSGVLPRHVNRRLYCLAGALELADMNFAALEREVDDYGVEVTKRIQDGDFDIEINSTSVSSYLSVKLEDIKSRNVQVLENNEVSKTVIDELERFGIISLFDLNQIMTQEFFDAVVTHQAYTTYTGTLRDAMMFADIDLYFRLSWNNNWVEAESFTFEMLKEAYPAEKLEQVFQANNIQWI
jgi:putative GTP pyrophosphokinase